MSNPLNPLLARVKLPGRVFQLPSKGLFYQPGVLADTVKNGEIHVRPMSALVELKIRSADLLYSNKVLGDVCVECAPEILVPEKLVARDVDALFTFLVATTYGSSKSVRAIHTCNKAGWHDYVVDLERIIQNPRNECLDQRELLFQTSLPNDQVVYLKPITFIESTEILSSRQEISRKESKGEVTHKDLEQMVVNDLLSVIDSVETKLEDGESVRVVNPAHIEEWIRTLPKKYVDQITEASIKSTEWGFDFNVKLQCKDCGELFDYDLELNPVNFFSG